MKILQSFTLIAGLAFASAYVSAQSSNQAAIPAQSQNAADPNKMAQKLTARVKDNVTGITPDQESKIQAANLEYAKGIIAAKNSSNGDRDAMRAKIQPLKEARDAKLKTILTSDQYDQYEKTQSMQMGGGNQSSGGTQTGK